MVRAIKNRKVCRSSPPLFFFCNNENMWNQWDGGKKVTFSATCAQFSDAGCGFDSWDLCVKFSCYQHVCMGSQRVLKPPPTVLCDNYKTNTVGVCLCLCAHNYILPKTNYQLVQSVTLTLPFRCEVRLQQNPSTMSLGEKWMNGRLPPNGHLSPIPLFLSTLMVPH